MTGRARSLTPETGRDTSRQSPPLDPQVWRLRLGKIQSASQQEIETLNDSLNPINVVVTPIPLPKADKTIAKIIPTVLVTAPPEKRKTPVIPRVREAYAATVSQ